MNAWWNGLGGLAQAMYGAAAFFSVLFLWQLLSVIAGLSADHADMPDAPHAHTGADAAQTVEAFQWLSVRSILTFLTLFTWGAALYLDRGLAPGKALGLATVWGLAGMASVALLLHWLPRMAQTGTKELASCVGARGSVYLDIPAAGQGQVRLMVSGVLSHADARAAAGIAIKAGTLVEVVRLLDQRTVEVKPVV